jgi:dihydroneopterin aldolase
MDIVYIRNLKIPTLIGAHGWERQVRQNVILNLEMASDVRRPAGSDRLDDALDYSELVKNLTTFVSTSEFHLIETLAEGAAELVLAETGVSWLRLELAKPRPLSGNYSAGVIIERGKKHP